VDDRLYIRDKGGDIKFYFDTNKGVIRQDNWQAPSLKNSWVNYSNSWNKAGFFKDRQGIVHLKGLVKGGNPNSSSSKLSTIFQLPAGYRPLTRELMLVITNNYQVARVDIYSNGNVIANRYSNGWLSLDGVSFRAHR